MFRFVLLLVVITSGLVSCSKSTPPQHFANPTAGKCPVMGEDIDTTLTYEYEGKIYAFCCKKCIPEFKANPHKYLGGHDDHSGHNH